MSDTLADVPLESLDVSVYTVPTDAPESDGTFTWDATTIVLVEAAAGGQRGLGYTYEHRAAATLIDDELADVVVGRDVLRTQARWHDLVHAVRNIRSAGLAMYAISAIDTALWDLKARLLGTSLVDLLGARHEAVPVYGSGGFTSYDEKRLTEQLQGWVQDGIPRVKMKVARDPDRDLDRVAVARRAVGDGAELYVDANGALSRKQALWFAEAFAEQGVCWFEEPVTSDDLVGLRLLRDRAPAGMDISAGEYGTTMLDFRELVHAGAVDCLQADITRCGGVTAIGMIGDLSYIEKIDLSAHTAPQLSAHAFASVLGLRHIEWFYDHVRIERMLFDGVLEPENGALRPDRTRPGHGLEFKRRDAERYRVA